MKTSPWKIVFGLLALVSLTALAYSPLWQGKFLWDDKLLVIRNPFIGSPVLALEIFCYFLFADSKGEFYRLIQNLTYIFNYGRAGLSAPAYHQTNIFIHYLNGILLFFLAPKLLRILGKIDDSASFLSAFFIAASWLLHPLHSAIVAYVSGRADSLALVGLLSNWRMWEGTIKLQKEAVGRDDAPRQKETYSLIQTLKGP